MLRIALPDITQESSKRRSESARRRSFKSNGNVLGTVAFDLAFTGIYMRRVWIPFLFGFFLGAFDYDDGKTKEGDKLSLSLSF